MPSVAVCALALTLGGCILDRSGSGGSTMDANVPAPDAAGFDGGGTDSGTDGGFDAGVDGGVDSAVPIPDACVASEETCDGTDEDCDGVVDDGLTRPCMNACGSGTETCTMGRWSCDVREPRPEACDDVDDDCDGTVDEGVTRGCSSACGDGVETCVAGVYGPCSVPPPSAEVCDDADNDCNGMVDDGLTRTCSVSTTGCGMVTGTETCSAGAYGPCVTTLGAETCNARDDDCDGAIDNGAGCPCTLRHHGSHAYLFCTDNASWTAARDACQAVGYELVTVNDDAENTFVTDNALGDENNDWWLGINDRGTEGTWVWDAGTSAYTHWDDGEPGGFSPATLDCGSIENGGAYETRGFWGDRDCNSSRPYVCESP